MQISQMMTGEHWGIITKMAIKREDKVERMKTLLETKIKDYVYKYVKLSDFVSSNMWIDNNEKGGWHYEGGPSRIVHAVEEREKCTLEIAKLLVWLGRYCCIRRIRDEKRDTTLVCYGLESSKRYFDTIRGEKLLSRACSVDFAIEHTFKKSYYELHEHVELEWVNEKLIRNEIGFK